MSNKPRRRRKNNKTQNSGNRNQKEIGSKSAKVYAIDSAISLKRGVQSGGYKFGELFLGFENVDAVRRVFGPETKAILSELKVEVFPKDGFMGVSDEDGHIFASQTYLNEGDLHSIYLDVVHELVHVKQFMDGRELFDRSYAYVDRPTEIEAYRIAADEGRRIGMSEQEVFEYLKVPWISDEEHARLALACNISKQVLGDLVRAAQSKGIK